MFFSFLSPGNFRGPRSLLTQSFSLSRLSSADSPVAVEGVLHAAFANAEFAGVQQLAAALEKPDTNLLIMPYGSAYPETAWPAILRYLDRGGNLLALGGKPFMRPAYAAGSGWQLRESSVAASLELLIHDYQETPGSNSLAFEPNHDVQPEVAAFHWKRAFSPVPVVGDPQSRRRLDR